MASRYLNLPRIELTTIDGQLFAREDRPPSESVLVIGPALDGPTDRPVRVNSIAAIEYMYGPITFNSQYTGPASETTGFSGNLLVRGLREVQSGGASDIRLLRVGGTVASGLLTGTSPASGSTVGIALTARHGGRIYNQVTATFYVSGDSGGHRVIIGQPTVKGGSVTVELQNDGTILEMVDAINAHPSNTTITASITSGASTLHSAPLSGAVTLAGGLDGTQFDTLATDKTSYLGWLTDTDGAFDILDDYEVDIVYLAGLHVDDKVVAGSATRSVATDFSEWLGERALFYPTLGVLGVRPLRDGSSKAKIRTHYEALTSTTSGWRDSAETWTKAGYIMNAGFSYSNSSVQQVIDAGGYLQVVAADGLFNDRDLGLYVNNMAGVYAGTIASLKPHMPTTHKPVNGIFGLPYEFSKAQLDTLVGGMSRDLDAGVQGGSAYVTVRRIEGRGILWTRDVTAAQRKSDFRDLQPLRIANAVHKAVKEIAFDFLGRPNDVPHRQALTTAIKSFLDSMFDAGALLGRDGAGYTLDVRGGDDPLSALLGVLDIDIVLRPALQIKAIRVRVRLSL